MGKVADFLHDVRAAEAAAVGLPSNSDFALLFTQLENLILAGDFSGDICHCKERAVEVIKEMSEKYHMTVNKEILRSRVEMPIRGDMFGEGEKEVMGNEAADHAASVLTLLYSIVRRLDTIALTLKNIDTTLSRNYTEEKS